MPSQNQRRAYVGLCLISRGHHGHAFHCQDDLPLTGSGVLFGLTFVAEFAAGRLCWAFRIIRSGPIGTISAPMPCVAVFSFTIGHNMPPSREICKLCFRANPVGFSVPDEIWKDVVPSKHRSDVVCISCFARLADEKLIPWDRQIRLYPVSMHTHLRDVKIEGGKIYQEMQEQNEESAVLR